jgi:hypothetical protein
MTGLAAMEGGEKRAQDIALKYANEESIRVTNEQEVEFRAAINDTNTRTKSVKSVRSVWSILFMEWFSLLIGGRDWPLERFGTALRSDFYYNWISLHISSFASKIAFE